MEQNNHKINNFISQVFTIFGISIIILVILVRLFGDDAKDISSIYQLGSEGLAVPTMLQFLLSSAIITALQYIIFSERWLKKMMTLWRIIILLLCTFILMLIFIIAFDWFPMDNPYAWFGFLICFGGGFIIGIFFMLIKTRMEDKKYNNLLSEYKANHLEGGKEDE